MVNQIFSVRREVSGCLGPGVGGGWGDWVMGIKEGMG